MAALSSIVQGIEFVLAVSGEVVRVVVFAEVLTARFGAHDSPDGWMAAFAANEIEITAVAMRRWQSGRSTVVLNHRAFSDD